MPTTDLPHVLAAAAAAARPFGALAPHERAGHLRVVADALDAAADELVPLAMDETHLPEGRLTGELARTTFQLRLFGDVLDEGAYLEATIDHPDPDWGMGPRPDVRRVLEPLGPVLVFAASNFPFAFSVAGGDTASALAAGCPVVLKAHPGHPQLSTATGEVVADALRSCGAPEGTFAVIHGVDEGVAALQDPRIAAGAFTGSIPGGRALFDVAVARPTPIPFYAEMGSLNPVVVTGAAVAARGEAIAEGYVGSFTLGVGQFCTKPGLLFLPAGHGLFAPLIAALGRTAPAAMLNERIRSGHAAIRGRLLDHPAVRAIVTPGDEADGAVAATLLATTARDLAEHADDLLEECFGPTSLVVEYDGSRELDEALDRLEGNLTATVHAEDADLAGLGPLIERLRGLAGRVIVNGWPTGVSVTHAMHHGGPYPATTAPLHTSVGTTAIRRFLRPVCYQDVPDALLPPALQEANPLGIPRRVDGVLQLP